MKALLTTCVLLTTIFGASQSSPDSLNFVASTPCDALPRKLLAIPAEFDCELITWHLTLYRNQSTQAPTSYTLTYTYGMSKPNTRGFMNGGITKTKHGVWSIINSPGKRPIYQLTSDTSAETLTFLRLDDKLLHLLDDEGKLMIGHSGWSYTMNRN